MNAMTLPRTLVAVAALSLLCGCGTATVKNIRLQRRFGGPPYSPRGKAKLTKGVDLALVGAASIGSFEVWTEARHGSGGYDWRSPSPERKAKTKAAKLGADFVYIGPGQKKETGRKPVYPHGNTQSIRNWDGSYYYVPRAPSYYRTVYATVYDCSLYRIASDPDERRRIRSNAFVSRMKPSDSAESAAKLLQAGIADPRRTMHRAMGKLLGHMGYGRHKNTDNDHDKLKLLLRSDDMLVTSIAYWMETVKTTMARLKAGMQRSAKPDLSKKRNWDLFNKAHSLLADALRDRPAAEPLIAALKDQDRIMRAAAAVALGGFVRDTRAVKPLIAALNDPEWHVRAVAAWALGEIGPAAKAAIPALTELSNDKDSRVRKDVAVTLGKFGDKRAVQPLLGALRDQDPDVRSAAANALRRLGWSAANDRQDKPVEAGDRPGAAAGTPPAQTTATLNLDLGSNVKMRLNLIPAGTFMMGSPKTDKNRKDDEGPQRRVTLTRPFYMGVTEVTQAQWQAVMNTQPWMKKAAANGGKVDAGEVAKAGARVGADHAANFISWNDATAFCAALSKRTGRHVRLPTEAEWEYACRAGTTTAYSFGDDPSKLGEFAWYGGNAYDKDEDYPHRVGVKKPNAWGLYDMHGNVWEWCADWVSSYRNAGTRDPTGPAAPVIDSAGRQHPFRVVRGGSSFTVARGGCRAAFRYWRSPREAKHYIGFRVVVSASGANRSTQK